MDKNYLKKDQMKVPIKKVREGAIIPQYQTKGSAGFDLHAIVNKDNPCFTNQAVMGLDKTGSFYLYQTQDGEECLAVPPMKQCIVPTGLAFSIPEGYELQIRPRSGLAAKKSITITNSPGTLDSDYLDELFIIIFNMGSNPFVINEGERIAQGVLKRVEKAEFEPVEDFNDEIKSKDRGGGFGSTGYK